MKTTVSTFPIAVLFLTLGSSASAALSTGDLDLDVMSAVGGEGHVSVTLDHGVATLTGFVDDPRVRVAAERAAASHEDVDAVDNRLIIN